MAVKTSVDQIDRLILRTLEANARTRNTELARSTGLSEGAVRSRIDWLEGKKFILGYRAILAPKIAGARATLIAHVAIDAEEASALSRFERALCDLPGVHSIERLAASDGYILRSTSRDLEPQVRAVAGAANLRVVRFRQSVIADRVEVGLGAAC